HMVIGGLLQELYYINDIIALLYTSIFGSAVSYGVYFYSAAKGICTVLDETFSSLQLVGAVVTLVARLGQLSRSQRLIHSQF
ncbi:hypothetical protein HID58_091162, partial [Brassica napus]